MSGSNVDDSATPLWVRTTVLEHYLGPDGSGSTTSPSSSPSACYGAAARRKFARGRFSSGCADGGGRDSASSVNNDWGWVQAWAMPQSSSSSSSSSPQSPPSPSSDNSKSSGRPPTQHREQQQRQSPEEEGPSKSSPFGHVKLRRVGSSSVGHGRGSEQQQQGQPSSPSWASSSSPQHLHSSNSGGSSRSSKRPPVHRSASTPVAAAGTAAATAVAAQPLTITIRDPDYPQYDGQTLTLSAEHVGDGDSTAAANSWWWSAGGSCSDTGSFGIPPDDLTTLTHLHEPAVVHCLRSRYAEGLVYTYTGPILLACNPFRVCEGLYSEEIMRRYWQTGAGGGDAVGVGGDAAGSQDGGGGLPPHVYAVADRAFRAMMRASEDMHIATGGAAAGGGSADNAAQLRDQSILVSGESGSGKTVTTKIVMRYLATLSQQLSGHGPSRGSGSDAYSDTEGSIESQVLQSNPILESFGNARTVRNDNSSRFGKFIEIQFNTRSATTGSAGSLVGASVQTYLLEKVRLISQAGGERNFHLFYELLAGANAAAPGGRSRSGGGGHGGGMSREERSKLRLDHATPQDFAMTTSMSNTYDRRDGVSDFDTYQDLRRAMDTVGFTAGEQEDVMGVASALLYASNLTFVEVGAGTGAGSGVGRSDASHFHDDGAELDASNPSLPHALHLLGVTADALNDALCACTIVARGERLRKVLNRGQATKALEALMMATYGALFRHIVGRVNDSITVGNKAAGGGDKGSGNIRAGANADDATAFISVLDIFGFESFAVNSFEQLCINYCNEALQQQFNRFVFKLEQQEYEREGIEWSFIEFPDNQEVLDLIERRYTGIFSVLDEQCRLPRCTDRTFVSKTYETCAVHPRFLGSDRDKVRGCFSVHHYAGPVEYDSESFLSKNRDDLPKETTDLLLSSSRPLLRELGEMLASEQDQEAGGPAGSGGVRAPSPTGSNGSGSGVGRAALQRSSSSLSRASVGSQFSAQLRQLRERIDQTAPHYVRCLKPNDELVPHNFVPSIIADQLRCAGVLEAVRVSRVGYPQRYAHHLFVRRYGALGRAELERARRHGVGRQDPCQTLVDAVVPQIWEFQQSSRNGGGGSDGGSGISTMDQTNKLDHSFDLISVGVQMGRTKVFLRQRAFEALEHLRSEKMDRAATSVQSAVRMFLCRDSYMFVLESVIIMQTVFRGYRAKRFVEDVRHFYVATLIQSAWRGFVQFDHYGNTLFLVSWCQRTYRGRVARRRVSVMNEDRKAVVIQSFWRMCDPYRRFRAVVRLVVNLQVLARSRIARSVLRRLKREAKDLDHIAKERDELRREAQRVKRELEEIKRRDTEEARQSTPCNELPSPIHAGGSFSVASTVGSVVYRDFPQNPTAQEEEIRALAAACAEKDREMERLRQALESIKEEKKVDLGGVPIETVFASNVRPDTPAATESTTASSSGLPVSPIRQSKRGMMLGRLDMLLGRSGNGIGNADCSSVSSHNSRLSRNAASMQSATSTSLLDREAFGESYENGSPRRYSLQQNDSREMRAYAPAELVHPEYELNETPLHAAVRAMDEAALSHFIDSCDDVYAYMNEGGHEGRTPLHLAVLSTNLNMTSLLLKNYAVANLQDDSGNTPLHYAEEGPMIDLLLGLGGANPNIPNGDGLCALHLAVRRKDVDSVQYLLSHQADVTVADDIRWYTPLHLVAQSDNYVRDPRVESSGLSPSGQIAKMLCEVTSPSEPDMNYQDRDGNTPLHHATVLADLEAEDLVTVFLENGSDPNIKNERGQTAMHLLCHNNSLRQFASYQNMLDLLLSHGGDPNKASLSGCTALHLCLYHRDIDSAVQLLHSGAQLHLPWRKPPKWEAFWTETGLPDAFCTDMVQDDTDLHRILAAVTTRQERAPPRPSCMRCGTSFGSFGKRHHCARCGSLVCKSCSSNNLVLSDLPDFCQGEDGARVCNLCEELVLNRTGDESPLEVDHFVRVSEKFTSLVN